MTDDRRHDDDEMRELIALEAVGALDDEERAVLEAALADRPDLEEELELLRQTAAAMADAVSEPPPSQLRASVLDAIAQTPQEPAPPTRLVAPVIPLRRRHRWLAVGAAAAAIIAIVVGVVVALPIDGDEGPSDQVAAVLDDEAATTIDMPGQLAGLAIVYSAELQAAVLTGQDLAVPEGDSVYELWAIRGTDAPEPIDTFRPNSDGDVALYLPGIEPASAVWAVTKEPAGGSDTPTLPILNQTA